MTLSISAPRKPIPFHNDEKLQRSRFASPTSAFVNITQCLVTQDVSIDTYDFPRDALGNIQYPARRLAGQTWGRMFRLCPTTKAIFEAALSNFISRDRSQTTDSTACDETTSPEILLCGSPLQYLPQAVRGQVRGP